jgi:phosphotransferase system  glucose/maltose/N-acetylglucosamine-specific IIC component
MKAMVAREVEIQRQDDKTRQNLILFILAGAGIAILCAALAYIMITKSADVASVAVQSAVSTGTGVSIK